MTTVAQEVAEERYGELDMWNAGNAMKQMALGIIANGFVNSSPRRNREGHRDGPGACTNFLDLGEFA